MAALRALHALLLVGCVAQPVPRQDDVVLLCGCPDPHPDPSLVTEHWIVHEPIPQAFYAHEPVVHPGSVEVVRQWDDGPITLALSFEDGDVAYLPEQNAMSVIGDWLEPGDEVFWDYTTRE